MFAKTVVHCALVATIFTSVASVSEAGSFWKFNYPQYSTESPYNIEFRMKCYGVPVGGGTPVYLFTRYYENSNYVAEHDMYVYTTGYENNTYIGTYESTYAVIQYRPGWTIQWYENATVPGVEP